MDLIKEILSKKLNIAILIVAAALIGVGIYCFATLDGSGTKSDAVSGSAGSDGAVSAGSADLDKPQAQDADAQGASVSVDDASVSIAGDKFAESGAAEENAADTGGKSEQGETKKPPAASKGSAGSNDDKGNAAGSNANVPGAVSVPSELSSPNNPSENAAAGGEPDKSSGDTAAGSNSDKLTATLAIDCLTILDHMGDLAKGKESYVGDGIIMAKRMVEFAEGETVFDVLFRECKQSGIHMSSKFTPIYNSAYIEGINQIYEFDCGSLSGWMYKVNGNYPNYGCSQYVLKQGDTIEWRYTTDLGKDIGGSV